MNKLAIRRAITSFLELIETGKDSVEANEYALIMALDQLALANHCAADQPDPQDYPDPPSNDYNQLRATVIQRFPNLGYYQLPQTLTTMSAEAHPLVADAIDDITDIALDLQAISWCWTNTSELDALGLFRFSYSTHWGAHLRELQFYLYAHTKDR